MKQSRYTEEQIIGILKQHEAGVKTADLCCKHGISAATFYGWKSKYCGMDVSEAQRLKARENIYSIRASLWHWGAANLPNVRIPMAHLTSQSPGHEQALAPRVFHLDRRAIAARVFDLKNHSIE